MIVIKKWSIELSKANSAEGYTSYNGIEMKLIIHEFERKIEENVKMSKFP